MPDGDIRNFQTETPARVGEFQDVADAILRGCADTEPCTGVAEYRGGKVVKVCVWGAAIYGLCGGFEEGYEEARDRVWKVANSYSEKYHSCMVDDFISGRFTREEIAARIAAL